MNAEKETTPPTEKIDYEKFVVRKALAEYWRAEEKLEIVMLGMTSRLPVTMLCNRPGVFTVRTSEKLPSGKAISRRS